MNLPLVYKEKNMYQAIRIFFEDFLEENVYLSPDN